MPEIQAPRRQRQGYCCKVEGQPTLHMSAKPVKLCKTLPHKQTNKQKKNTKNTFYFFKVLGYRVSEQVV